MLESSGATASILVVDDDPTFCTIMRELLTRQGHAVRVAFSVAGAIDQIEAHTPDLILTDIMMPETDGLSLLKALSDRQEWASIPTVVVSARVLESDREAAKAAGAMDFISKPFTLQRLKTAIQPLLCSPQIGSRRPYA